MGKTTIIAWTDHTWNMAWGCTKVSAGCKNCYADTLADRYGWRDGGNSGPKIWGKNAARRIFGESHWREPLKWNREAEILNKPERVFCSSMCDVFEDHPTINAEREKLWPLIRATPMLHWQLLTKRPERIARELPDDWGNGYHNVWLGTSIENNDWIGRADYLRHIPAVVRFISYEPALGPLDQIDLGNIDWVIAGGESGPGYRDMEIGWAVEMEQKCRREGVAFFFKQSSGPRTEMGIDALGGIVRQYPTPRTPRPLVRRSRRFRETAFRSTR